MPFLFHGLKDFMCTGSITSDTYKAVGVIQEVVNFPEGIFVPPFTATMVGVNKLVGPGPGNNLTFRANFHVTINANGEVTANVDNEVMECK